MSTAGNTGVREGPALLALGLPDRAGNRYWSTMLAAKTTSDTKPGSSTVVEIGASLQPPNGNL